MAWVLLKLRRLHGRHLVFEVHGLPSSELLDRARPTPEVRREAERLRALEQTVFDGAWRLLAITDCLRNRLIRDYAVSPDRTFKVPDASSFESSPPGARAVSGSRPRLMYVGQLYPWKGVDLLVRAMVEVPDAELMIVGGLPGDPQQAALQALARQLAVDDRVVFRGPCNYGEVPSLLATASIALLPLADGIVARCFTSPLKLFDYLAAGVPIVAVDYPTVREVLTNGENALLVPPGDPSAMAAAINTLLADPALSARLSQRAAAAAADHTWDRRAEQILTALGVRSASRSAMVRTR
jgi:glycosyltransferase involved in cell wall biosynthesis